MQKMNYSLASSTWDECELAAIQRVIDSDIFTMGENVARFERDFAAFVGAKYAVMTSSGSTANLIATAALFYTKTPLLQRGDEVIVPAVSWSTTYFPLYQYGLRLKFVDIDLHTLNYDLNALKSAISAKTKMIMCVNLLGNPNDFDTIFALTKGKNIIIFEDNCESLGATYKGKQAGTFGLVGTFSTFYSHHMATMEGGFVATDNEEIYHILLSLRAHGWTRNLPKHNLVSGTKSDDYFEEAFKFVLPGYNVRPVEMSGAIGVEQLKKLPEFLRHRRENARYFMELFGESEDFIIQREIGESSWFGFSFLLRENSKLDRSKVLRALNAAGIEYRPINAGDFTQNEVIKYLDYEIHGELKNAKYLDKNGFFVGNHQIDIKPQLTLLAQTLYNLSEKSVNLSKILPSESNSKLAASAKNSLNAGESGVNSKFTTNAVNLNNAVKNGVNSPAASAGGGATLRSLSSEEFAKTARALKGVNFIIIIQNSAPFANRADFSLEVA